MFMELGQEHMEHMERIRRIFKTEASKKTIYSCWQWRTEKRLYLCY